MKTINSLLGKSLIMLTLLHFTYLENVISQKGGWIKVSNFSFGVQINEVLNGSGHGMVSDIDLIFKKGKSEIATGVFAQNNFEKISGLSFQYKYFIIPNNYAHFYTHYTFMYHYQNCLNNNWNQQFHPQDFKTCCEFEKFNTISNQIGIGLETMTLKNLFLDSKIGIGGYMSKVVGADNRNKDVLGRDDNEVSLLVSIGLLYRFTTKDKKRKFGNY
jgi:hypothetical protein